MQTDGRTDGRTDGHDEATRRTRLKIENSDVYHMKKILKYGVNLLKPSGNFTYYQVNIKKFYVVPTLHLCVLYGSQNKQQLLPYKTLRDWFL
jgi:hypothetical protein